MEPQPATSQFLSWLASCLIPSPTIPRSLLSGGNRLAFKTASHKKAGRPSMVSFLLDLAAESKSQLASQLSQNQPAPCLILPWSNLLGNPPDWKDGSQRCASQLPRSFPNRCPAITQTSAISQLSSSCLPTQHLVR